MKNYENIKTQLVDFLRSYLSSSGASGFVLGLSGGLDSAVVACLCALAAPGKLSVQIMPSKSSSSEHLNDALELCKSLDIEPKIVQIEPILSAYKSAISDEMSQLRMGNLAARIRMSLLYDLSASLNALVVGTSNKSELMLGYGTIYGDMACALNPIGELLKTEVRELASVLGISQKIISKAPSADLWQGQSDEKELGYSYDELDSAIADILSGQGRDDEVSAFVLAKMKANEFKRQMPPIAKIWG